MVNFSFLVVIPVMMLVLFESVFRGNVGDLFTWVKDSPYHALINYLLFFGLINIFYWLPRKVYLSVAGFFLLFFPVVGIISSYKIERRGEPLLPWDLALTREAFNISTHLSGVINVQMVVIAIISIALIVLGVIFAPKEKMIKYDRETKMVVSAISLVVFIVFFNGYTSFEEKKSISLMTWDQKMNYEQNGHFLGFVLNTRNLSVKKPQKYDEKVVAEIVNKSKSNTGAIHNEKPNIIYIQSEAFWDPTVMDNVTFSEDPLPYFRSLTQEYIHGKMYSPVYGGNTANTEFEVLTGHSTQFLPKGVIPYVQYVHNPMESLASVLSEQGYKTTGVHPYESWFYRRDKVYANLGFDRFISSEFFNKLEFNRGYAKDRSFVERILKEVKDSKERDFVFGVSMEGHGPYYEYQRKPDSIKVTGDMSAEAKGNLETYAQTIAEVDKALKLLIDGLTQLNEPTIVVFYGDHLPMLGDNYAVYREAGYFDNEGSFEDYKKSHEVPFLIWDNFTGKNSSQEITLSSSFLSPYVLNFIGEKGTTMFNFLQQVSLKDSSVLLREDFWDMEGLSIESRQAYQTLQYDLMFGSKFANKHIKLKNPDKFILGPGEVVMTDTNPKKLREGEEFNVQDGKSVLEIKGENFFEKLVVFANGKELETTFHDEHLLTVVLPEKYINNPGSIMLQLKAQDSLKTNIVDSHTIELEVEGK